MAIINALDLELQTGSYSPGMQFNGSSAGLTYSQNSGWYQIIGSMCFINVVVSLNALGSFAANATASIGLPFTASNAVNQPIMTMAGTAVIQAAGYTQFSAAAVQNQNFANLVVIGNNNFPDVLEYAAFVSGSQVYVTGFYFLPS